MTITKPERVTILLNASEDLAMAGQLAADLTEPQPEDYDNDEAYEAAADAYDAELDRRVTAFAAAYRAEAEKVAADEGIDIEVLDYNNHPDRQTFHAYDDQGDTWERVLWQQIHDRTSGQARLVK